MRGMFHRAEKAQPNVTAWDVSAVEDFDRMFKECPGCIPDVSRWNTTALRGLSVADQEGTMGMNLDSSHYSLNWTHLEEVS